jgi:hypothetical protein
MMRTTAMHATTTATPEQYIAGLAHVHTQNVSSNDPDGNRWLVQAPGSTAIHLTRQSSPRATT